jgi:hypothetical protein
VINNRQANEHDENDKDINPDAPWPMNLPTKKRLELLAYLIVDRIEEDMKSGSPLLKKILKEQKRPKPPRAT